MNDLEGGHLRRGVQQMLTARRAAIGLALCLAMFPDSSQSQPPPQQPPPPSQSTQPNQNSQPDQRGTETSPFIVKILPTPESEKEAAPNGKDERDKENNDATIALFTRRLFWATAALAVIGAFQLFVFGWQGIQLRNTVRATEKEFTATHRPKIRVKHLYLMSDIWAGDSIIVSLWCVNTGINDAILNNIGIRYHVVRANRALPIEPHIERVLTANGAQLESGRNVPFRNIDIGRRLSQEENDDVQSGRAKLYCVGYIDYFDGAGRMRITGFCRILTFPPNTTARIDNTRFRQFCDPDYEYED